jgi:hypothetical protein
MTMLPWIVAFVCWSIAALLMLSVLFPNLLAPFRREQKLS